MTCKVLIIEKTRSCEYRQATDIYRYFRSYLVILAHTYTEERFIFICIYSLYVIFSFRVASACGWLVRTERVCQGALPPEWLKSSINFYDSVCMSLDSVFVVTGRCVSPSAERTILLFKDEPWTRTKSHPVLILPCVIGTDLQQRHHGELQPCVDNPLWNIRCVSVPAVGLLGHCRCLSNICSCWVGYRIIIHQKYTVTSYGVNSASMLLLQFFDNYLETVDKQHLLCQSEFTVPVRFDKCSREAKIDMTWL